MGMLQVASSQDALRRATEYDMDATFERQISFRLSQKQYEMLEEVARENRIKRADVARIIFEEWCASRLVEQ